MVGKMIHISQNKRFCFHSYMDSIEQCKELTNCSGDCWEISGSDRKVSQTCIIERSLNVEAEEGIEMKASFDVEEKNC